MGDCAELLLDGTLDPETGEYLGNGFGGHERSYWTSNKAQLKKQRKFRLKIAKKRLERNGFKAEICERTKEHLIYNGWRFFAQNGKIRPPNKEIIIKKKYRGIKNFINILKTYENII